MAQRSNTAQAVILALRALGIEVRDEIQYDDGRTVLYVIHPNSGFLTTVTVNNGYPLALLQGPLLEADRTFSQSQSFLEQTMAQLRTAQAGFGGQGEADL